MIQNRAKKKKKPVYIILNAFYAFHSIKKEKSCGLNQKKNIDNICL